MSTFKTASLWLIVFVIFIAIFFKTKNAEQPAMLTLAQFFEYAEAQPARIVKAIDRNGTINGTYKDKDGRDAAFQTSYLPGQEGYVLEKMVELGIDYDAKQSSDVLQQLLFSIIIPVAIFVGLWIILMRQIQSGGSKAMSFGKSRAKVTFDDVAGVDEAKEELKEIVEFLKDPKKFSRLGGKIPKGVLLYGRPGTGKTLLAKAVAGEANVPFFSISGSDFVEMFVGVGASRVRDLFEQGKRSKPCLIFIDEIDAVGRHRFTGIGGGHDEREQTLNQLLVEMDGFNANEGVILIAATNRPDVLDPALLRPGRFDRQIAVDFPDVRGREKILAVHSKAIKLAQSADLKAIAKGTPGFSGADLANLINEAALLAARRNREAVDQRDLEEAKDRVMMGPERRSMVLSEKEKENTAYHEAGHALARMKTPDGDPIHKVTIIPRGRALGLTSALPEEDRHNYTLRQLRGELVYALGGRAAEKLKFGEFSTGAVSDIQRATHLAYRMVCEYGMSELGPRMFGEPSTEVFLGREMARDRNFSEATAARIDEQVKKMIDEAYEAAETILRENADALDRFAQALIERETLTREELELLLEGKTLPPLHTEEPKPPEAGEPQPAAAESAAPGAPPIVLDRPKEQPS
ncbi:MAG: ATP-dependent zinc metalloprotease FtsH [candidate division BRC1 bacterium ADurb.BinA364]|nr:MAG: ATP-dependent zinc metalloprotease FtsH [candidate division BRC1 bacterium ADurb.BinA364]